MPAPSSRPASRTHQRPPAPVTPGPRVRLVLAGLAALLCLPAAEARSQTIGEATRAEFDLSQRERVGGGEVTVTDSNLPGQDGGASLLVAGSTLGTYGDQAVSLEAEVTTTDDGTVRLLTRGRHGFDLTGISLATDVWLEGDSDMLVRSTLVDELTLSNVPGNMATLELYFQLRGMSDAEITKDAFPADLSYTMATQIQLDVATSAPHTGGGTHAASLVFPGGYLPFDLDEQRFVDDYVVLTLDVDPTQPIPLTIELEITPLTNVSNFVEIGTLNAVGRHEPWLFDNGAELLGAVVKDNLGNPINGALIGSAAGYAYPVSDDGTPPPPFPPPTVVLSPVAVVDTDLGDANPVTVPREWMIDQSGLSVPFASGQTGFDVHFSQTNALRTSGLAGNAWQSATAFTLPLQGFIDFDLGATQIIDRLVMWSGTLEDIRVQISDSPSGPWTELGQYTLTSHLGFFSYNGEILDLGGIHAGRYLRIQVDSAYLVDPSFTWANVGEVAVSAIPLPEPGFAGAFGTGVLLLGVLDRRRRSRH